MVNGELTRELMHILLRTQTSFRQAIQRQLKQQNIDLSFEMFQILAYLWRKDGVNQQELATNTFKDKASLTSLLHNMEKKNLVKRTEDQQDRRNKQVFLTEQGWQYFKNVWPLIQEIYSNAGMEIDKARTETMMTYLTELNDVFKKQ